MEEISEVEQEMSRRQDLASQSKKSLPALKDALKDATTKLNDTRSKLANLRLKKDATSEKLDQSQDRLSSLVGSSSC